MFTVVLVEPQIPQNTGNIARLCAATNIPLILVGELGFEMTDRYLKRAGLDYWDHVHWRHEPSVADFFAGCDAKSLHLLTTKSSVSYTSHVFCEGDFLVFGSETKGLPESYLQDFSDRACTIPMANKVNGVRSLNLSTSVGIVVYEGLRQNAPRPPLS